MWDIKAELINRLRNADIMSVGTRGVATTTQNDTGNGVKTDFILSNLTSKNVRLVQVNSVTQTYGTDYTFDADTATVSFTVAPGDTLAVAIQYDYGVTDHIWPDFPQPDIKLGAFPRIAIDLISAQTREIELGASSNFTAYDLTIVCYDRSQKNVEQLVAAVRSFIMDNKKTFYYTPFITPVTMGMLIKSPFGENKVFQRNQDFKIRFVYED